MFNEEQTNLIQEAMWFFYLNQSMPDNDWKEWHRIEEEINEKLNRTPISKLEQPSRTRSE